MLGDQPSIIMLEGKTSIQVVQAIVLGFPCPLDNSETYKVTPFFQKQAI